MSSDRENNSMESSSDEDEVIDDFMDFLMIACMHDQINASTTRRPQRTCPFKGDDYIFGLLTGHPETMMNIMRMDAQTFILLKDTLLHNGFIDIEHMHISVEESLGIFLYTFAQNDRHRLLADRFQHSTETICRHIKIIMRALCKLASTVIRPRNQDDTPAKILNDRRFFPWFKDCVGAIDGTLVDAWVPASRQNTFRGRKSTISQNVLAACDFDMLFTFINSGWEGSAHDNAILIDSITRADLQFPHPPNGSAHPMLTSQDVSEANKFVKEITNLKPTGTSTGIPGLIAQHMVDLGAEVCYHKFHPQLNKFHPLHSFSGPDSGIIQENCSCSSYSINTVGIIRAPRGDGKEAIVLVTPYDSVNVSLGEALSLGIASSVFSLLTRVTWLAKDIIWLAADSQHGEYASVAAWLRDYHTPLFGGLAKLNSEMCHESSMLYELKKSPVTGAEVSDVFRRAGTMAAALVIKVCDGNDEVEKETLSIYAEASNGQMPNLDLINVVSYLAVHGQGLHVKVEKFSSLLDSKWLRVLGETFESLGKVARRLNPQWKFGMPVADYIEGTATLASSLYHQALGVPTGLHGAFRDYQVDAITLEISPIVSSNKGRQNEFLLWGGRLVEGVLRSVNNLLEKFHQSFFLYLLTSPSKFVSVGVYMIAFALLVAPLPLAAASLYSDANKLDSSSEKDTLTSSSASVDVPAITFKSWNWLHAAKTVFVVHIWSVIITLLPYFISQILNCTPTNSLLIWVLLSVFCLLALRMILGSSFSLTSVSQLQKKEWALLKSVTISAAFVGLCLMSVINFATAEIGALLIVPMCLTATPLRFELKARSLRSITRAACNLVLAFIGFPPNAYVISKGLFEGFGSRNVGDFWNWLESLWAWNSATYLYVCMVHIPCWVLCVYILLHHC